MIITNGTTKHLVIKNKKSQMFKKYSNNSKNLDVKFRFNTPANKDKSLPKWRLFVSNVEYLVNEIKVLVPSFTQEEIISDSEIKHNVHCLDVGCVDFESKDGILVAKILKK